MPFRLASIALAFCLAACAHQPTPHERELIAAYCGDGPIGPGETDQAVEYARHHRIECDAPLSPR